jgi:predicted  nucleic acid-binding Zn-ribbon protein
MDKMVAKMMRLQELMQDRSHRKLATERQKRAGCLRRRVPENLLRRFDHLVRQKRLGVATLSKAGACGNCHLMLPSAEVLEIRGCPDQLHTCPYCGCYLYSPPEVMEARK